MNKLATLILLALSASMIVANEIPNLAKFGEESMPDYTEDPESQLAPFNPSDEDETAGLVGNMRVFEDFCIQTRDYIIGDLKQSTNDMASRLFRVFFKTAGQITVDAIGVQNDATNKIGNQIRNPDSPIAEGTNDIENIIADGQKKVQEAEVVPKTLFQGIVSTIAATGTAIAQQAMEQFELLKRMLNPGAIVQLVGKACEQARSYEEELNKRFEAYKQEVVAKDPTMADLTLNSVQCLTTKRVLKVEGGCSFATMSKVPVQKMFTNSKI